VNRIKDVYDSSYLFKSVRKNFKKYLPTFINGEEEYKNKRNHMCGKRT